MTKENVNLLTLDLNLGFCKVRCPRDGGWGGLGRGTVCAPAGQTWRVMTHLGTGEQQKGALLQILLPENVL